MRIFSYDRTFFLCWTNVWYFRGENLKGQHAMKIEENGSYFFVLRGKKSRLFGPMKGEHLIGTLHVWGFMETKVEGRFCRSAKWAEKNFNHMHIAGRVVIDVLPAESFCDLGFKHE